VTLSSGHSHGSGPIIISRPAVSSAGGHLLGLPVFQKSLRPAATWRWPLAHKHLPVPVHFLSSCRMRQHIHDSDPEPLPWNADEEEIQSMKKFDTIGSPIAIIFSNITLRDFVFARSREAVAVGEAWSAIVGRRLFARPAPCTYSISHVDTAVSTQLEG
jgi:hypothetical protein